MHSSKTVRAPRQHPFHAYAQLFPLLEGAESQQLLADIQQNGVHEPIDLLGDEVLDGRNRYRALAALVARQLPLGSGWGVRAGTPLTAADLVPGPDTPWLRLYKTAEHGDPLAYVISRNLTRRHLDESQRAMIAARLAKLKQGQRSNFAPLPTPTRKQAADLLNVSERTVQYATVVRDHGVEGLQHAVDTGEVRVSVAADVATLPADEQQEILARGEKEILAKAKEIRGRKAQIRRNKALARNAELARWNQALPANERKYCVIYADPPWRHNEAQPEAALGSEYAVPYPTMSIDAIKAMGPDIERRAADDCGLFLWVIQPLLPRCFEVIEAWGFKYVTIAFCWNKLDADGTPICNGMGTLTRQGMELCIYASRGKPTRLGDCTVQQRIDAIRHGHSHKPDEVRERIEKLLPGPYLELFARHPRDGWEAWGNQVDADNDNAA